MDLSSAQCIRDTMVLGDNVASSSDQLCGRADSNTSNKVWRCDEWLPRPNQGNYKDNLNMAKLEQFERDKKADVGNKNIEKFIDQPTGWGKGLSLEDIGLSRFIQNEIEKDPDSRLVLGDCDSNHWCTRDSNANLMRSCGMNVVFTEGTHREPDGSLKNILKPKLINQKCLIHERCEQFLDNGNIRTFNSCP